MARAGRPPIYGPEIHQAICVSLAQGLSRTTAAELAGIDRATLTVWAGSPPEWNGKYLAFSRDVRTSIAKAKARATATILKSINNGDVASAWRYMAMQEREEWREQPNDINVNHGGAIRHNVHEINPDALTPEERERARELREKLLNRTEAPVS